MKVNQSELIALGGRKLLRLHRRGTTKEVLDDLLAERSEGHEALDGIRGALLSWVINHFDRVRAQHRGFPDCAVCPDARLVQCFAQNRAELERGGYLTTEERNTWVNPKNHKS